MKNINLIVSENLKKIRKKNKLSLEDLANLSGVSKSMIVKIEKGLGNPSLSTLWKIANALEVPFNSLINTPKPSYEIININDIEPLVICKGNVKNFPIFPDYEHRKFSIYYIEIQENYGYKSDAHISKTIEFITIIKGSLELKIGSKTFTINEGESIRFKADQPHSYTNVGESVLIFHNILYNP